MSGEPLFRRLLLPRDVEPFLPKNKICLCNKSEAAHHSESDATTKVKCEAEKPDN